MKMVRMVALASFVLTLAVLGMAPTAQAQVGFIYPNGDSTWLHSSRLQPGANVMIPGTAHYWHDPLTGAAGRRFLGLDGRWHGETQFINPNGARQTHVYSGNGGSSGYRPSGSMGGSRPFGYNSYGLGSRSSSYRRHGGSYLPRYGSSYIRP